MKDQGTGPGSASPTPVNLEPISREVHQDSGRGAGNSPGPGLQGPLQGSR